MNTIILYGSSGMLGTYIEKFFKQSGNAVISLKRADVVTDSSLLFEKLSKLCTNEGSVIINCVGVIKPLVELQGFAETVRVNSLFPHMLSESASKLNCKMIHITTDCVFSGLKGYYSESSTHDAQDLYGRSKSLGEPPNCTVIRTSIIGEEKLHKRSLVEWAKSQKSQQVYGYINHSWNGVTCLQLAKVISQIIEESLSWQGVRHVFSPSIVTKKQLLDLISQHFELDLKIVEHETKENCFRSLITDFPDLLKQFQIPELSKQIAELKGYL